jgi:hypothetical protein
MGAGHVREIPLELGLGAGQAWLTQEKEGGRTCLVKASENPA